MREALLIMVHGSPRAEANEPVYRVAEVVRQRGVYPIVEVGFLECNEPDIPSAIETCVRLGAGRLIAVPYFLHTGNHVAEDLPRILNEAGAHHPGLEIRMGGYLGMSRKVTEILGDRAREVMG